MRRRKLLLVLAGLFVAICAAVMAVILWPMKDDRLTEENCARIHGGMTREEVEATIGPPGDFRTGPIFVPVAGSPNFPSLDYKVTAEQQVIVPMWYWDNGTTIVWISSGRVANVSYVRCARVAQTPVDNFLWRAKRQWHRWFP
jgi:hypothetical protein